MTEIVCRLNQTLRGVFEYFKHVSTVGRGGATELTLLDGRVRFRLRRLLGKRHHKLLSGRSMQSHQQWTNQYFHDLGLYSLHVARQSVMHARRGNS
jgi:RNA-directed DNA polymerase